MREVEPGCKTDFSPSKALLYYSNTPVGIKDLFQENIMRFKDNFTRVCKCVFSCKSS